MKKEQLISRLEKDNNSDLKQLNLSEKKYEKLKKDWFNKEIDEFDLVRNIEIKKQIIQDLINNF